MGMIIFRWRSRVYFRSPHPHPHLNDTLLACVVCVCMTLLDLLVDRKRQSGRTSNKIRAVFDVTQRVWAEYVMMMCNEFVDEWLAMSSSTSRGAREWWGWSNVQRIAPFALDYSKWIDKSPANSAFTRRSSSGDEIFQLTSPLISSRVLFVFVTTYLSTRNEDGSAASFNLLCA